LNTHARAGTAVAEALIALINPPDSPIRVLSIAGAFNKVLGDVCTCVRA
jgi:hypothetical protein